ncbi:hypothetical protein EV13_0963 [Prochlorococcus sp. MIT 0702]|nr:hypothetical protein EV12_0415 [Prochlorococcus sp. MIT 0701]KGG29745.1 hypothetical protein EV13_0963 [Prochlorococcus sp. MIT 0702]KGG34301.1 hypothetical protein EV14_1395 [Prochlorococcus sp. MIT 0703]
MSARPSEQIDSPSHAVELLETLGIQNKLAEVAKEQCPGLGKDFTWAFYLERHGWLTASQVLTTTQILSIGQINPPS